MDSVKKANILIALGVAAWVPYAVLKYLLGYDIPVLPFLVLHLCGVLPGGYLRMRERVRRRRT